MTLTDDIARDLARRIAAQQQAAAGTGGAAPQRLTLAALAKEYGVSATPFRHALALLLIAYHAITWFQVMPKTAPRLPVPPRWITLGGLALSALLSLALLLALWWVGR